MEKNFLPGYEKTYFVFTDDTEKKFPENVIKIPQDHLPWPYPTLNRFEMFLKVEKELKRYDYIYFLNANAKVINKVGTEILPSKKQGIMVALHPFFINGKPSAYTYERNPNSTAYISQDQGKIYAQGCFNGGRSEDFLKLIQVCADNIRIDKKNNIIAVWHDESHLNKYILDKDPLVLGPEYIWPTLRNLPNNVSIKILMRDKKNYGGHNYLRHFEK